MNQFRLVCLAVSAAMPLMCRVKHAFVELEHDIYIFDMPMVDYGSSHIGLCELVVGFWVLFIENEVSKRDLGIMRKIPWFRCGNCRLMWWHDGIINTINNECFGVTVGIIPWFRCNNCQQMMALLIPATFFLSWIPWSWTNIRTGKFFLFVLLTNHFFWFLDKVHFCILIWITLRIIFLFLSTLQWQQRKAAGGTLYMGSVEQAGSQYSGPS